jgi:hypothetical protein
MIEDTFAFIIHPIQIKKDAARKVPIAKYLDANCAAGCWQFRSHRRR